jgi:hypothetical protein
MIVIIVMMNGGHNMSNGITGSIKDWKIVDISTQETVNEMYPGEELKPCVLVGVIVEDYAMRFRPGNTFRSSLIKSVDLKNKLVYTRNSTYQLINEECDSAEAILDNEMFALRLSMALEPK